MKTHIKGAIVSASIAITGTLVLMAYNSVSAKAPPSASSFAATPARDSMQPIPLQVYPAQNASMPPGNSGQNICGSHCSFIGYNNGGQGFTPAAGTTMGVAEVTVGSTPQPNSTYHLMWRASATLYGCAANDGTELKTFASNPTKTYVITVYFKPGYCPPQGTTVTLNLEFL